jgi:RNA polymerase sigma factor (sigma-70 family)
VTDLMEHLRCAVLRDGAGLGDGGLLSSFIERHDEVALAALVRRHGPMVWGVCRRLLAHHDAEDAFQATFIVLVKKAASVEPRAMVANWLYGVAHQTALHARRTIARRRVREVQVEQMPDPEAVRNDTWADVQPVLDEELSRLPDIYRAVVVLCDLEGRTRREVARQLGVPEGTVGGRLARARVLLAKRLAQRGIVISGGALAGMLSAGSASASPSLVASTIKVASLLAAGRAAGVSLQVVALTEGVVKAMLVTKIKSVLTAVLVIVALCGATGLICRTQAGERPKTEKKADDKKKEKARTDKERLQGKWQIVSMVDGGKEVKFKTEDECEMTFKGESSKWRYRPTVMPMELLTSFGRFRLDEKTNPKVIDVVEGEAENLFDLTEFDKLFDDAKERREGIYAIDGDTLKLCFSTKDAVRPTAFESKEGADTILYVLKRVLEKAK